MLVATPKKSANPLGQNVAFLDAIRRFKGSLKDGEKDEFDYATLGDLEDAIAEIEEKHASAKKMRNMARLRYFLEAMGEYSKVIEVFLNCSNLVAYIWVSIAFQVLSMLVLIIAKGPVKFLLQVSVVIPWISMSCILIIFSGCECPCSSI